ncbi:alkyl/aryl-sulfatase [Pelomonas sp. KK5]|uniref:alkyl/aryl-sulfatase n=1 Tax=Pelomonas sp. KK5 TaxID=1855730 RepID=UPI00097C442D|nr:alkyl sulfatase dimerization domain-containing protein [Pelomonas sp. KK5]
MLMMKNKTLIAVAALLALAGTAGAQVAPKGAEAATAKANADFSATLPWGDKQAFEDAKRGFIAGIPGNVINGADGKPVWNMAAYDFLKGDAPATVNPSLWRQAQLDAIAGLFKVADGMYQLRGLDLSNMTIIEGKTGLIVIDPLLTADTAKAGLELYYAHRPKKPVVAVIYSHGHADHFGGVKGVASDADVAAGKIRIYAPDGFMETAIAENIIAGNAMSRRAAYQFGALLPPGPMGHVDTGLGKALSRGGITLIPPTDVITAKDPNRVIDGVPVEFILAPGSEAPAEMMMYFPQHKVLDTAEVTTQHMHNVYTIRGAEVRDANKWSGYISDVRERYAAKADTLIMSHHWPVFGPAGIDHFLVVQRDLYKFIHDQTVRLLNQGWKPGDIANTLKMPASLDKEWSTHGYYGTLSHNSRAIYQKYLGWYDANPANLNPLPDGEQAKKAIEYMGGADAVIAKARADFAKGEYRWVASVMSQIVSFDPANQAARSLGADALEQLGYQAEAGTWRGAYLTGAQELRNGVPKLPPLSTLNADTLKAVNLELFFDFLGVRLNAAKADGKRLVLNWNFTDSNQKFVLNLENSALTWVEGKQAAKADAGLTLTREALNKFLLGQAKLPELMQQGLVKAEGDPRKFGELFAMFDNFTPDFAIVEPLPKK